MNKTKLSKICGISRTMIYNLLRDDITEEQIIEKYIEPKEVIKLVEDAELIYSEGKDEGYKQCEKELRKEFGDMISELKAFDRTLKDLKSIKNITKKVVLNNWNKDTFDFRDVNEIYEIVKDY